MTQIQEDVKLKIFRKKVIRSDYIRTFAMSGEDLLTLYATLSLVNLPI